MSGRRKGPAIAPAPDSLFLRHAAAPAAVRDERREGQVRDALECDVVDLPSEVAGRLVRPDAEAEADGLTGEGGAEIEREPLACRERRVPADEGAAAAERITRADEQRPAVSRIDERAEFLERSAVLRIAFEGVTEDSRCPTGTQCVWAGDAAATFSLEKPPAAVRHSTLHTNGRFERQVVVDAFVVRLEDIKPYPKVGAAIAHDDYRATLVVTRR